MKNLMQGVMVIPGLLLSKKNGKIDFSQKVGGYTGAYGKGEAGELYISDPVEGTVYAYGQKDYRGSNGGYRYIQYKDGEFTEIEKSNLIEILSR